MRDALREYLSATRQAVDYFGRLIGMPTAVISSATVAFISLVALPALIGWIVIFGVGLAGSGFGELGSGLAEQPMLFVAVLWLVVSAGVSPLIILASKWPSSARSYVEWIHRSLIGFFAAIVMVLSVGTSWDLVNGTVSQRQFARLIARLPQNVAVLKSSTGEIAKQPVLVVVADAASADGSIASGWLVRKDGNLGRVRRARQTAEVGTVLAIVRSYAVVRKYAPAGEDYQVVFRCYLLSWPNMELVRVATIDGPSPSDRSGSPAGGTVYGQEPWSQVAAWLDSQVR